METPLKTAISRVLVTNIKPYAKNAKKHPLKQIKKIANSIKEFGFQQPIVLDKNNVVIVGHGRLEAAKLLGLDKVPCVIADLSEEQAKAYRLADNKLNESEWDMEIVIEELKLLNSELLELTGFKLDDLNDDVYTKKIESPIYNPTGKKPEIIQLYNEEKVNELIKEIEKSNISDKEKKFLKNAAQRHRVFDYGIIAEYYAHADKEMQELMENSALIIIDFNKAIEKGFTKLDNETIDFYKNIPNVNE